METLPTTLTLLGRSRAAGPAPTAVAAPVAAWSALVTGLAGLLTAFTVSLVGEFPVGEFVLFATFGWAGLCAVMNRRLPGRLFHVRYLWVLLAAQVIALLGYAVADYSWHSASGDVARGWGRMGFLVIDVVAVAYLFSRSRVNFLWMLAAQLAGDLLAAFLLGARFGDPWKFGCGLSATYAVVGLAASGGPVGVSLAAAGLGWLNFALDFRSLAGLCLLLAAAAGLHLFPRRLRHWLLPVGIAAALALVGVFYEQVHQGAEVHRTTRSDVDRSSMIEAALRAFRASPVIGHGSWFSRSHVYEDFLQIRDDRAQEAGVGGFAGPNEAPEAVALHSQLLVALAEGGLFGGAFFFVYGAGLAWALHELAVVRDWERDTAVRLLLLLLASWHLLMSPFSGAHRVYIATAAGLLLLLCAERRARPAREDRA